MGVAEFPNEILLLVFELVANSDDEPKTTLCALSQASRKFYELSGPFLYRDFEVDHREFSKRQLRTFLRTMSKRPSISFMLRDLAVDLWPAEDEEDSNPDDDPSENPLEPTEYAIIEQAIHNTRASEDLQQNLLQKLSEGREEAELAAILILCPNIEHFSLDALRNDFIHTMVCAVFQEAGKFPPQSPENFLTYVSTVTTRPFEFDINLQVVWSTLFGFLTLPSLKVLETDQVDCRDAERMNNSSSKVEILHLDNPELDPNGVKAIIETFPALKSLHIIWENQAASWPVANRASWVPAVYNERYYNVDWPTVKDALREHGHTLDFLNVELPSGFTYSGPAQGLEEAWSREIAIPSDSS